MANDFLKDQRRWERKAKKGQGRLLTLNPNLATDLKRDGAALVMDEWLDPDELRAVYGDDGSRREDGGLPIRLTHRRAKARSNVGLPVAHDRLYHAARAARVARPEDLAEAAERYRREAVEQERMYWRELEPLPRDRARTPAAVVRRDRALGNIARHIVPTAVAQAEQAAAIAKELPSPSAEAELEELRERIRWVIQQLEEFMDTKDLQRRGPGEPTPLDHLNEEAKDDTPEPLSELVAYRRAHGRPSKEPDSTRPMFADGREPELEPVGGSDGLDDATGEWLSRLQGRPENEHAQRQRVEREDREYRKQPAPDSVAARCRECGVVTWCNTRNGQRRHRSQHRSGCSEPAGRLDLVHKAKALRLSEKWVVLHGLRSPMKTAALLKVERKLRDMETEAA